MGNPLDPQEFRRQAHMVVDFIADYYQDIEKYPVRSQVEPGYLPKLLPKSSPTCPEPIETILQDVKAHILPGLTHWQSPNYFAFFPASASIAGHGLAGANALPSKVLPFSGNGGGVLQGTTCEVILCTLVAARDRVLSRIGRENIGKLVVYGSDQTHCSFQKASRIVGIHQCNFRIIKTDKSTSFALSPDLLRTTISADVEAGLIPIYVCATVGTTSTTSVDPLGPICNVAQDYTMWVHVDAAYAGNTCICPEFRHFIDGVEGANSFSMNAHKWFFTTHDCCCLWVREPSALVKSLSTNPEYLRSKTTDSKQVVDYKDWQITLSRRFRALKLWLVLRSYGVEILRNLIRSHVEMAKLFEGFLATDKRFEIVVPRNFALVCFRISPSAINMLATIGENDYSANIFGSGGACCGGLELSTYEKCINDVNCKLLESINSSGHIYMTHAVVDGVFVLRFAVGATLTEEQHVFMAWEIVKEHADATLNMYKFGKL
ncbi:hypothetical protein FNV43_RR21082 [Rhamnella rubrinervis]|uniref:Tyrosine decarboxylase n=1 Tax=Rhamnella rubrinervis TaxID=2594499 RepID=A0A8K0DW03_9ROSA|nr:hypothetical protein FNV43_RR21082 [Rhamnella rubrinervis]